MKDAQKIALIASFLLRYPDEQWYNELPEWREDAQSVGHPQLRQGLLEFFDYVEESDKKEFEDQYVRTFDFSQNTTMYLSTYELQGTGEQAEELVKFKAFFLENDYDLPKEMPDYIPALLELCAVIDDEKQKKFTTIVNQNWNTLENASLRLNCLMHSCLILSCLLQMDWRTVHDESIPLGRFALHRFHLLNRRYFGSFLLL